MDLYTFGYHTYFNEDHAYFANIIARIVRQDKDRYRIIHHEGFMEGLATGNLQFTSTEEGDLPVVGDWVKATLMDDRQAVIHGVLERKNQLKRRSAGTQSETQVMAANIDYAVIIQSAGHDFNPNRLERYLAIARDQKITPMVVINKIDLLSQEERNTLKEKLNNRFRDVPFHFISCTEETEVQEFINQLKPAFTYCFLGSSGVGKSTLLNLLLNKPVQKTKDISSQTAKGKHTTTRREMFVTRQGAIIIDTPGKRELGLATGEGAETVFTDIQELAEKCHFKDCSHENEPGCAVIEALENGTIDRNQYLNFLKLRREQLHYARTEAERRRKDKEFGKMQKRVKSIRKRFKG
jgi:ribosome biogenesis GTPase